MKALIAAVAVLVVVTLLALYSAKGSFKITVGEESHTNTWYFDVDKLEAQRLLKHFAKPEVTRRIRSAVGESEVAGDLNIDAVALRLDSEPRGVSLVSSIPAFGVVQSRWNWSSLSVVRSDGTSGAPELARLAEEMNKKLLSTLRRAVDAEMEHAKRDWAKQ